MDIHAFWQAVLQQNADAIRPFFHSDAIIRWHCSNECFTVDEFIRANCEYPGNWDGEILRTEQCGSTLITAVRVYPVERSADYYVTSFFRLDDGRIKSVDEFWADASPAPAWRQEMHIGKPIRNNKERPL